jgi:DNA-binding LacI/PurR family transcriptional regulator
VRHDVPHVFVNRAVEGSGRNVTMELRSASWLAVERLVDLGHRSIGHVAGPADVATARMRAAAFVEAAEQTGVALAPVQHGTFDEAGGAAAVAAIVRDHPQITAVYTSSLSQAVGALHSLRRLGLRVPQDLSVIAYDEMPLAGYLAPPLDTVAMPLEELGRTAVRALIAQIEGGEPRDVVVPTLPRLVLRGSTTAP